MSEPLTTSSRFGLCLKPGCGNEPMSNWLGVEHGCQDVYAGKKIIDPDLTVKW